MHEQPGKDWSVETLADQAGMSRTAFAVAFSEALGASPIQYLTEWRVTEAKRLLADRRQSVAAVAEQLGYQSEAAFRRAFKRVEGVGPGQVRKREGG
ncbi:MAG TPA: AraC family transcriptional regulator [Verrucomicrobiae bacterium]|nr:AraC family transcriptional regulator [Verrucomicrobiae bacterium]